MLHSRSTKPVILMTIAMDILSMTIIIPVIPSFIDRFGTDDFTLGLLVSIYAFASFFSAPLFGALADKYGRKFILFTSILGSAFGWGIVAIANSMVLVFIGRLIDGITAGNITIAQTILGDIATTEKEKISNLGLFGMIFGFGFMIAPVIGSILMTLSPTLPFEVSAGLSLLNAILVLFFLKETGTKAHTKIISLSPFHAIFKYLRISRIAFLLMIWFCIAMAFMIPQSIFALYLKDVYAIPETESGFVFMWSGLWIVIGQGFLLRRFWLHFFSINTIIVIAILGMIGTYTILAQEPIRLIFMMCLIPSAIFQVVLRPVLQQKILSHAPLDSQGEMNGVIWNVGNIAMIIAPIIGGYALVQGISIFELSLLWLALALVILIFTRKKVFAS